MHACATIVAIIISGFQNGVTLGTGVGNVLHKFIIDL